MLENKYNRTDSRIPDPSPIQVRRDIELVLNPDIIPGLQREVRFKVDLYTLMGRSIEYLLHEAFETNDMGYLPSEGHDILAEGFRFIAGLGTDLQATNILTHGTEIGQKVAFLKCHGGDIDGKWIACDFPINPQTIARIDDVLFAISKAGEYCAIILQICNPGNHAPVALSAPIFYSHGIIQGALHSQSDTKRAFMPAVPKK